METKNEVLPLQKNNLLDCVELFSSDSSDEEIKEDSESLIDEPQHGTRYSPSRKSRAEKRKEIIGEIQKFTTKMVSLEKEKNSQFYRKNRPTFTEMVDCLEGEEKKMTVQRKCENKEIKEDFDKIRNKVERLKLEKKTRGKTQLFVEKMRVCIEDIESTILQVKQKQSEIYEELCLSALSLEEEIENYNEKFSQWKQPTLQYVQEQKNEIENEGNKMPPEVQEFEIFLKKTGGHQGGWDEYDHNAFLQLKKQRKKESKLIEAVIGEIATRSHHDVIQHVVWYKTYCELREQKREAIRAWKVSKQREKDKLLNEEESKEKFTKQKKMLQETVEQERLERFSKLEQWKKERIEQLEKENEKREREEERIKLIKHANEEERQLKLKTKVEEYRRQKDEEEEILKMTQQQLRSKVPTISEEEKEKIRERNELVAMRRREKQLAKEWEEEERIKRLEKLKSQVVVNAARDPSRLLKLTEGLKHRKDDRDKTSHVNAGINNISRRAVPTWRKGLQ